MSFDPLLDGFDDARYNGIARLMFPEPENHPPGLGKQSIRLVATPNVRRYL